MWKDNSNNKHENGFLSTYQGIQSGNQGIKNGVLLVSKTTSLYKVAIILSEGIAFIGIAFLLNIVLDKTHT